MSLKPQFSSLLAMLLAVGCSDVSQTSAPRSLDPVAAGVSDRGPRTPERYVAIGTSISMGWASNGVYAGSQLVSWPALLGFGTLRPISLPLIQSPGCTSPIVAPIGGGKRLSGESISGSTTCAPLVQGITLPTQNVALAGALAADAVQTKPEAVATTFPWYTRVLPTGTTQLTATLAQQPTIVSVELGGNEVLNATSGLFAPGVTVVPFPFFAAPYDALLDALGSAHPKVVLVGLPNQASNLPAIRRGDEIWADRAEFAALHVDVSPDCALSPNYINVSLKSLDMVFTAAFTSTHGLPNPVFSCADIPGTVDYVLTPGDMAAINDLLAQMTAHVRAQATARGYAYFSLGALYDRSDLKGGAYSVVSQMTSNFPYGFYTSLDGVHPNALGHAVLAVAAAKAINDTYGNDGVRGNVARVLATSTEPSLADREVEVLPAMALQQARAIAAQNQGVRLGGCSMPGACSLAQRAPR